MNDDHLTQLLTRAADEFPVHRVPVGLEGRVAARRRGNRAMAVAGSVAVLAALATVVPLMAGGDRITNPAATYSASYVGSRWRLISVSDATTSTSIPADAGASVEFRTDQSFVINDGTNALTGHYSPTSDGFEVRDVGTTYAVYAGNDPRHLAAIAALNTVAYGNREGVTQSRAPRGTLVKVTDSELVVRAGDFRLTFSRVNPTSAR